jgi:hypothetical protein
LSGSRFSRDARRGLRFDHDDFSDDELDEVDVAGVDGAAHDQAAKMPVMGQGKISRGDKVRHPRYGIGTVQSVAKEGHQTRCQVLFHRAGMKKLVLEFAGLEKL